MAKVELVQTQHLFDALASGSKPVSHCIKSPFCDLDLTCCRCLQENQMGGDEYTERMDAQLPEPTILLFRRLAHAKVQSSCSTSPSNELTPALAVLATHQNPVHKSG